MARKKTVPYAKFIRALHARAGYENGSLKCLVLNGTVPAGYRKKVPAGSTYMVLSDDHPIAWIDKDGAVHITTDRQHPKRYEWGYFTVDTAVFRRHIKIVRDNLIPTEVMQAEEDEAIASIMSLFAERDYDLDALLVDA